MLYDKDIREPLFSFLEESYGKTRMIEEKRMGISRADIVMVTEDAFYGIEIKSDADSYARLSRQVTDYDYYFDYNYIAVGTRHAEHVAEHVPAHWGIITVEELPEGPDFYILRRPRPNPHLDIRLKLTLLWRPELAALQALNELPKYKDKAKKFVIGKIAEKIPYEILRRQMSTLLFERDYTLLSEEIRQYKDAEKKKRGIGSRTGKKTGSTGKMSSGRRRRREPALLVSRVVRKRKKG